MELQIQDLVSSIKKDGIDSANREAAAIVAEARKQAEAIVADAKAEADRLRGDARAEIEVFESSAQLNAEQARRDAVLAFQQEIQKEFEKLLAADAGQAYSGCRAGGGRFRLYGRGGSGDGGAPSGAGPGAEGRA